MMSLSQAKVTRFREKLEDAGYLKYVVTYRDEVGDRKSLVFEDGQFFLCNGKEKTMSLPYPETLAVLMDRLQDGYYPVLCHMAMQQDGASDSIKKETPKTASHKSISERIVPHAHGRCRASWM